MKRIDRDFAPAGCYAVKEIAPDRCFGCIFWPYLDCFTPDRPCIPNMRPDGQSVIFIDNGLFAIGVIAPPGIAPAGMRHDGSGWAHWDP